VGVVGLGLMGHGIGLVSAQAGYEVVAVEAKPEALEAGKKRIGGSLKKMLSKARWMGGESSAARRPSGLSCRAVSCRAVSLIHPPFISTRCSRWRRGS